MWKEQTILVTLGVCLLAACDAPAPADEDTRAEAHTATPRIKISAPVTVGSGASQLDGTCGKLSDGKSFPSDAETDPRIAVNPDNPDNIVIALMQDAPLAVSVATTSDGGRSWVDVVPPRQSPCSEPTYNVFGDQDIGVDAEGRMYLVTSRADLQPEGKPFEMGQYSMDGVISVATSTDSGASWSQPVDVSPRGEYQHTALIQVDHRRAGAAMVIWHVRTNGVPLENMPSHLDDEFVYASYTSDAGQTWTPAVKVGPAMGAWELKQLPDSTFIAVTLGATLTDGVVTGVGGNVWRSTDNGATWESLPDLPKVSNTLWFPHPEGALILAGDGDFLATGQDGALHLLATSFDAETGRGAIHAVKSPDGGMTWGAPVLIEEIQGPAWNGAIGRTQSGSLVAMWYDSRNDASGDAAIETRVYVAVSFDDGANWTVQPLSEPFDMAQTPEPHGPRYLGNYHEIKALGPDSAAIAYGVSAPQSVTGASDLKFVRVDIER